MKFLVVEDSDAKRYLINSFFKDKDTELHFVSSVNPGILYAIQNSDELSGIILDLGLTTDDNSSDYADQRGLDLVVELKRQRINIPVLINSTTIIDLKCVMEVYPFVKGQMKFPNDYSTLEGFISSL